MSDETPAWTAASTKDAFFAGTLWLSVVGVGAAEDDGALDDLCVALHNSGEIDFLSGIDQPAFEALQRHQRWRAYEFIGRVTPRLDTTWGNMANFVVRAVAGVGGGDVYEIHKPFLAWLIAHPTEAARGVALAEAGDPIWTAPPKTITLVPSWKRPSRRPTPTGRASATGTSPNFGLRRLTFRPPTLCGPTSSPAPPGRPASGRSSQTSSIPRRFSTPPRSLSYLEGPDGKRRMFETPLAGYGFTSEMPHQDVLDPVAMAMQNYQLRHGEPR